MNREIKIDGKGLASPEINTKRASLAGYKVQQ